MADQQSMRCRENRIYRDGSDADTVFSTRTGHRTAMRMPLRGGTIAIMRKGDAWRGTNNNTPIPCKPGCPERSETCHGWCEKYKEFCEKNDDMREKEKQWRRNSRDL